MTLSAVEVGVAGLAGSYLWMLRLLRRKTCLQNFDFLLSEQKNRQPLPPHWCCSVNKSLSQSMTITVVEQHLGGLLRSIGRAGGLELRRHRSR